ncbi:MAG TPA: hypothetical protein VFC07_08455 [Verrucomicrobiae bacterium]|nr:hypothetical protein [Verrucomicrobiae bacterium]
MAWYQSPFENGRIYRARKDIAELGHTFDSGECVEFVEDSYDPKLGVIRFWFKNVTTKDLKAWHVWENEITVLDTWRQYFEAF